MNNPRDRLAYSKAPRSVDYQPNTKPINRGAYVEIQKLKPDLNREVELYLTKLGFCFIPPSQNDKLMYNAYKCEFM